MDKTLLILDTNCINEGKSNNVNHSRISSSGLLIELEGFLEEKNLKDKVYIGMSEITLKEHLFHRSSKFNDDFEELKRKANQFKEMEILEAGSFDIKFKDSFNYSDFLIKLVNSASNFVLFSIPEEKKLEIYDKILQKSINHEKPFNKKGDRNFRDALIWESIACQDLREYSWVIFLTFNKEDFPQNNDFDEINRVSENTGKIVHICNSMVGSHKHGA